MTECKKFLRVGESLESGISEELESSESIIGDHPPNTGAALRFLQPLIKYGQFSTAISYSLYASFNGKRLEYFTRRPRIWGIATSLLFGIMCLYMSTVVVNFKFSVSNSKLVNMIKRVTYGVFVVKLVILYSCLQTRGRSERLWVKILKQSDLLQEQFANLKIPFPSIAKARVVVIGVCSSSVFLGLVHVMVFSLTKCQDGLLWYERYTNRILTTLTFGFWNEDLVHQIPFEIHMVCGTVGALFQTFSWNLWYFVDAFRVVTALLVWAVFNSLNKALAQKKLRIENLSDVMDLHCGGVKLLNLLNQLMAPITLCSMVFNILYACFWTNYCLLYAEWRLSYIVGVITLLRMIVVFYFVADVNSQAYQISTWMENHFAELDKISKTVDKSKLTLFTSLMYSREAIGFKGMHFFTCTQVLNIAIGGLVLTYSFVVNQVATQQ